jgi:hypothetical protein
VNFETKAEFIRAVVETFAPETLGTYDKLVANLLPGQVAGVEWTPEMKSQAFLLLWEPGAAARARPN